MALREGCLVFADRGDDHLVRGDVHWPADAVLVVMLLHDGGDQAGDADAVAAHDDRVAASFFVEEGRVHLVGVVGAEDEDVSAFDAPVELELAVAVGAGVAGGGLADRHDLCLEVAAVVDVLVVVGGFSRACDRVRHGDGVRVCDDAPLEPNGADESDLGAGRFLHRGVGCEQDLLDAEMSGQADLVDLVVSANDRQHDFLAGDVEQ